MIIRKVAIILFHDDESNILIQNRKNYSKVGEEYGFFGGGINEGENAEEALKREMKEELGIEIKEFEDLEFFKKYREIYPEINRDITRNVFLAKIPDIKKLDVKEGSLVIMKFEEAFNLKMVPGDTNLLKEIYKFLKNKNVNKSF